MPIWKPDHSKPIIGLAGGIGSGKSTIGALFVSQGCALIDSDALAHQVIQLPEVKAQLGDWLGPGVFKPDGSVDRKAVAGKIFSEARGPENNGRLNRLIHPQVALERDRLTQAALADPAVKAVLWDSPLLFETGLNQACDAVVFVKASRETRLQRLAGRGWSPGEVEKREKFQFSLDKKAELADYCIDNSGDKASALRQVQRVLSQIITSPS